MSNEETVQPSSEQPVADPSPAVAPIEEPAVIEQQPVVASEPIVQEQVVEAVDVKTLNYRMPMATMPKEAVSAELKVTNLQRKSSSLHRSSLIDPNVPGLQDINFAMIEGERYHLHLELCNMSDKCVHVFESDGVAGKNFRSPFNQLVLL